jgi:hypothetical protein
LELFPFNAGKKALFMHISMNISCVLSSVHNCHAVTTFPFTTKLSWGTILPSAREITPIKTYMFRIKAGMCKLSITLFEN